MHVMIRLFNCTVAPLLILFISMRTLCWSISTNVFRQGSSRRSQLLQNRWLHANDQYSSSTHNDIRLIIPTIQDMQQVGAVLYSVCSSFDAVPFVPSAICVDGDLAAGKTAFCQGFIRAAIGDWERPITSPTYLLSNSYTTELDDRKNEETIEIRHMDLYRLSGHSKDLMVLDLPHVFAKCISLIEWPGRLGDEMPKERLDVRITIFESSISSGSDNELVDLDNFPRNVLLRPFGNAWDKRIQHVLDEGYLDDLLMEFL
ncbi:hypothetical protein MPSEU_000898800 [Mayamaea pseudoterrestris]|nr:hypothetical protein MPSEU_000898800 [Mayamaea pseudoterrestris]